MERDLKLFVFTGCASRKVRLTETGFLSSYTDLYEDEGSQGMYVYKNPDVKIGDRYSKILIAPVRFELDPAVDPNKINNEDKEQLAGGLPNQIIRSADAVKVRKQQQDERQILEAEAVRVTSYT